MGTGEVRITVTADTADAQKSVEKLKSSFEELDQSESALGSSESGSGPLASSLSTLGSAAKSAGKAMATTLAAGAAAAATAVGTVTVKATEAYADYEQLVGGVETLFGANGYSLEEYAAEAGKSVSEVSSEYAALNAAQDTVTANADAAWKTCGMSANEYMENATSFAASLVSSLDGDTQAAADVADVAMQDMSDNANKMGTDIDRITDAYQGFAKQNYTMLDNLKLGYGGTKTEMERLISDANELAVAQGEAGDLTIDSYADVVEAIHLVQENMGITGTTAKEAEETIQGSVSSMKAAWENWLTALAAEDMDISEYTENLIGSIETVVGNVIPVVAEVGNTLVEELPGALSGLSDALWPYLVDAVEEAWDLAVAALGDLTGMELPAFESSEVQGAIDTVQGKVQELQQAFEDFTGGEGFQSTLQGVSDAVSGLPETLGELAPLLGAVGGAIAAYEAYTGVAAAITAVKTAMTALKDATLLERVQQLLLNAAMNANPILIVVTLIGTLVGALVTAYMTNDKFRERVNAAFTAVSETVSAVVGAIVGFFTKTLPGAIETLGAWFGKLPGKVGSAIQEAASFVSSLPEAVTSALGDLTTTLKSAGKDLIRGLIDGIKEKLADLGSAVAGVAQSAKDTLCDMLGISSPSKVFMRYGTYTIEGYVEGLRSSLGSIRSAMGLVADASTLDVPRLGSGYPTLSFAAGGSTDNSNHSTNIYVSGIQAAPDSQLYGLLGDVVTAAGVASKRRRA